jgi:hypothetical protein
MLNIISAIIATMVTLPILTYLIIFLIAKKVTGNKKSALKIAADGSTLFFIFSVHYIVYEIWQQSYLWVIIIIMLVIAILLTFIYRTVYEDIDLMKLLKGIWRMNFVLFVLVYTVLFTYGLTYKVLSTFA